MKQVMREYLPMELEKDDRVYGGLDAALRAGVPQRAEQRWLEVLKPYLAVTPFAEVGAAASHADPDRGGAQQRASQRIPRSSSLTRSATPASR